MAETALVPCWRQGKFELTNVNHSARSGGRIGTNFQIYMLCVLIRIASTKGDSNENSQNTIFNLKKRRKSL